MWKSHIPITAQIGSHIRQINARAFRQLYTRSRYKRNHCRTYAFEYGFDRGIVFKLMEKQRNGKDYEKRRKHAAQRTCQCPGHFSQSVAYVNAHVHGKNARNSLGNGQKVEKVAFVYPLFLSTTSSSIMGSITYPPPTVKSPMRKNVTKNSNM